MKITVAENAGFCFGVKRATNFVENLIKEKDESTEIYTLGNLIHNDSYIKALESQGVFGICVEEALKLSQKAKDGKKIYIIIRTHGIPKQSEELLRRAESENPNFKIVDMTCPFVKRIHKAAEENTSEESMFVLLGTADHPEVQGILSYVKGDYTLISSDEDIEKLVSNGDFTQKNLIFASQTTQSLKLWKKTQKIFKKLYTNAKFFDTICSVTENRQNEAVELAKVSDAVIVIGGKTSSNTKKLFELCRTLCPNTQWIETADEIDRSNLGHNFKIAITAGASTPNGIIMEVYKKMSIENFEQMLEDSLKTLHTGETVHGIVTAISDNEVYVDLGTKVTGVIAREQITDDNAADLRKMFKIGEEVTAFVIRVEDGKGTATLSKKRVDADKNWLDLCEKYKENLILEGEITKAIKGGVIISVDGLEIFIPASQTGLAKDADLSPLVGTTQRVRLIDVDEKHKKAIASIKVILNEERKEKEAAAWAEVEVGKHYMGTVKNFVNYGAFVDLGGIDGMVHNSELSWKRIKHPSQILEIGQQIDVFVKEFDAEKKRISLGYKTQEMDSWYQFTQKFQVGDVCKAKIVNVMPFGAFAEVYDGVDGLIHISKISHDRIENPKDVLSVGQEVDVKITEIDDENRKLSLSMKALVENPRIAEEKARREAEKAQREAERAERIAAQKAAAEEKAQLEAEMAPYIVKVID
ncbi:MAG: bifunctional 4-hydroxy-3-methylbut-2-enyl diphosphate reductase/30S ribosomal protein S1 [Ruminococcaceae bacterium]|nr:bifunctional 4-hydroxy-3-methylbut-2-enyl diphosphate reductase/30S ribosomal protein S1 [Oscillospiraceae bacterium]